MKPGCGLGESPLSLTQGILEHIGHCKICPTSSLGAGLLDPSPVTGEGWGGGSWRGGASQPQVNLRESGGSGS